MREQIEVVFENGVLRPLEALSGRGVLSRFDKLAAPYPLIPVVPPATIERACLALPGGGGTPGGPLMKAFMLNLPIALMAAFTAWAPVPDLTAPNKLDRLPDSSPELRKELYQFDVEYRGGAEEKFAELEKRADELAKQFPAKDGRSPHLVPKSLTLPRRATFASTPNG